MTSARPLIALVDDEESVRRAIQRLIVSAGLDVVVFRAGREFLDALFSPPVSPPSSPGAAAPPAAAAARRPDCVVLDLHMPGMSGFEIQTQLAARVAQDGDGQKIPVVIITGHDTPDAKTRVLAAGAAAYLRKPVQGTVLLDAIKAAITSASSSSSSST